MTVHIEEPELSRPPPLAHSAQTRKSHVRRAKANEQPGAAVGPGALATGRNIGHERAGKGGLAIVGLVGLGGGRRPSALQSLEPEASLTPVLASPKALGML